MAQIQPATNAFDASKVYSRVVVGQNVLRKIDTQVKISIVLVLHQRQS